MVQQVSGHVQENCQHDQPQHQVDIVKIENSPVFHRYGSADRQIYVHVVFIYQTSDTLNNDNNNNKEEMFLSNGNRFKYFAIACHLELVIIKCVINFFHLSGACFVVVLGLADAGLPACVYLSDLDLQSHVTTEGIIIQILFYFFASSFACEE
ncbi:hypothetical protein T01_9371 [Trichinella spiralis]|uniref:Uncharacterized protein n=1 Tax=Trichinella spiralis TaxID=6334 RepID=A0A0V1AXB7_TRISP|nr:hypothetical protein T01_9371 [Trichinella spiralis]